MDDSGRDTREAEHRGTTRRWFLAGGAAVVLGAGAGVVAEFATHEKPSPPRPPTPPRALVDAIDAEKALLADLDATTGGAAVVRAVIRQVRADHAAHLTALTEVAATYGVLSGAGPASPTSPSASASRSGTPRTRAALRDAELRASAGAARRADALTGGHAALLASIAAAEATHADLLT